jgi:diguanylate cyclase (GGDEF)-like protein
MNSLEKKLIAAIGAVVILLIAAGIIAFKALNDAIDVSQEVSNTREILTEVESTLLTLKDAESDQRGYIVAGGDPLKRILSIKEDAKRKIARLRSLSANNDGHREKLASLEPMINKKLDRIHEKISHRTDDELAMAKEAALSDEESRQMDNIGELLGEIKDEEKGALEHRVALSEQSIRNVSISFGSLFILIVALLFLVFFLVKKDLVTQKQLQGRLNELASVDELTTLYNRRELNRCFTSEVERFRRYRQPFALFLLDIDHFKSVNDTYGHPTGDRVLQHVANKIRDGIRSIDVPARWGGEEFGVILPNTKGDEAFAVAERLREKIAREPFEFGRTDDHSGEIPITVSIGISVIEPGESESDLIRTADKALYVAKNEGRNRSVAFEQIDIVQCSGTVIQQ